jgi:hypothetical protein
MTSSWNPSYLRIDVYVVLLLTTTSWFRQGKFASFQRQLNIYGFTRITSGTFLKLQLICL